MNISSVLVHAVPDKAVQVQQSLADMQGVEVHAAEADGRIIVTIEDDSAGLMADSLTDMFNIRGVLSANMVYHYCDDTQSVEEGNDEAE